MSDTDQPLRIVHLASSSRWTGFAEPASALAAEEIRQGHQVEFACIGGSSFEHRLAELRIPFIPGFYFDRHLNPGHLRRDIVLLRRLIQVKKPDIIHCHLPHDHWMTALALRCPFSRFHQCLPAIVRTMHRDSPPRHDIAHRWLLGKGAEMVIAVSQSQRQALIDVVGLPQYKVKWIRGAVDLERFRPGLSNRVMREILKVPVEAHVAGMVARMQPQRGHYLFLNTLEEVVKAEPMAFYAFAGWGGLKEELMRRIQEHRLSHHLRRIGYRKDDLPEMYAAMDVVVLLIPGSDGTCRAMLEAMACGRPVIGSRQGAYADTIIDGVNGWLVESGSREDLVRALNQALCNLEQTRRMGAAARAHVERHHTRMAQQAATLEVYREAIKRMI
jgi:glycosyltransferase involved in cell wall biosynthesis